MATVFVASICSIAILSAAVRGTESSMPGIPQSHPQKIREKSTTSGLRFKPRPINFGSSILPTINWMERSRIEITSVLPMDPDWNSVIAIGGRVATIEPMVGIKFKAKVSTPQSRAKSTPAIVRTMVTSAPVKKLIRVFKPRYCWTDRLIFWIDSRMGVAFLLPS